MIDIADGKMIVTFTGTDTQVKSTMSGFIGTNNPNWVKVSIDTLSKDVKTQSDNIKQVFDGLQAVKQDVANVKSNIGSNQAEMQRLIDRLDDLASMINGVTPGIHHVMDNTKPLDSWDLAVDGIGKRTITKLPYKNNYLIRYMKNGVNHIASSRTNEDIKWEDVGGMLAYTELVSGLGMMQIWPGTP